MRRSLPIHPRWLAVAIASCLAVVLYCFVAPAVLTQSSQVAVFEQVWQTVRDNFYDPNFNGVNWQAMRQKYRSQATAAKSPTESAIVINQMLGELKTSHTRFYTQAEPAYYQLSGIFRSSVYNKLKPFLPDGKLQYTGIGIFTQEKAGKTFVSAVLDGSPAATAGLKVGDQLLSVDNQPFRAIASFANKAGQSVFVQIQRTSDPASTQTIAVTPKVLDPSTMFLDAMKASVQVIEQGGRKIGYVHVWSYADEAYQDQLERELTVDRLKDTDGLIWDLRDGWGGASPSYLNLFTGSVPTVTLIGRDGNGYRLNGQWKKPVVMVVNQGSRSGKEILAYGFRKYQVGSIVGSKTAGAVVAGRGFVMSDGSLLYLAVADVKVEEERLEGKGMIPDIEVPFTLEYAQGADPQKERAIQVVLKDIQAQPK